MSVLAAMQLLQPAEPFPPRRPVRRGLEGPAVGDWFRALPPLWSQWQWRVAVAECADKGDGEFSGAVGCKGTITSKILRRWIVITRFLVLGLLSRVVNCRHVDWYLAVWHHGASIPAAVVATTVNSLAGKECVLHPILILFLIITNTYKEWGFAAGYELNWCNINDRLSFFYLKILDPSHNQGQKIMGGDESNEDEEIIFERLQVLYMKELDELKWFYPGNNFTLRFPSLEEVFVINCDSMKTFSAVNKIDHSTKWYSEEDATPQQESDLNSALRRTFEEKTPDSSAVICVLQTSDTDEDSKHGGD
ncbi:unnamed protein product [Sphenostylis stenocarpa]|uniref:Uncharacterized protein n=1 Tax=Sphenostylis stenocarpa TaxID=92480 RepID=A0AA86T476_9FABA|nr:unnamed protein product [Sphenostylis stenocarpa]